MIERKSKEICEKCENFMSGSTRSGYPIYRCRIEHNPQRCNDGHIWHKLSTVLYTEPLEGCPYYVEHFIIAKNGNKDGIDLQECHRRLIHG